MKWYEKAAIHYDWAQYGRKLGPDYAKAVVGKTLDLHADTLAFCVQLGGYALWESQVTPKAETIGDMDLVGELSRLCKKHDLRFVPWWLGTALGVERILRVHPDWQLVGPPQEDGSQKQHNYICYNSPYRELLYEEVREVLTEYEVDGIYFDQLPGSCYCPTCRAKFQRRFGKVMPIIADEFFVYNSAAGLPPLLRQFRDESVREFCAGVRNVVNQTKPDACYAQNWVRNQQAYLAADYADVLLPEFYQREDLVPLGLKMRLTKAYFNGGPIWGNVRHSVKHDARHNPIRGTKLLLYDALANRASPLMLDLCCMDFDATGTAELAETFDHIRQSQETLSGAEPEKHAALVHSRKTHELYPGRFDAGFEGMYRLLMENHVQFELVTEADLGCGALSDYKVLVLPDVVSLSEDSVAAIRAASQSGMGVVATHMTGLVDDMGRQRPQPALADLFGIEMKGLVAWQAVKGASGDPVLKLPDMQSERFFHYSSVRGDHPLCEGLSPDGRSAFYGSFLSIAGVDDSAVFGDIHAGDQATRNGRIYNRPGVYPGPARWPLGSSRQAGKARCVYFAPQIETTESRLHGPDLDQLLVRAVNWAGGSPPIEADGLSASVEVRLLHNPARKLYQILLVNLTTNSLTRSPGGWGVIRYVTPQKQVELALRTARKVKSVASMCGAESQFNQSGELVHICLDQIDLYDSLAVEYE